VFFSPSDICVYYTFILIFKFILINLLHVLFILKIEGVFGKRKIQLKRTEMSYFLITAGVVGCGGAGPLSSVWLDLSVEITGSLIPCLLALTLYNKINS